MKFFSWLTPQKEKTEEEKEISIETYAVEGGYRLKNPLIVVGFPGSRHESRVVTRREILIRHYLDRILIKKQVKTETEPTEGLGSEKRDLRGKGRLDRSYHNGLQYHFYEVSSNGELKKAIERLEGEYGLTINRELPAFLVSDLERII